jgi:hypothetical protein
MLAFRSVQQSDHCAREEFLYELKAGPAGGRPRLSAASRPRCRGGGSDQRANQREGKQQSERRGLGVRRIVEAGKEKGADRADRTQAAHPPGDPGRGPGRHWTAPAPCNAPVCLRAAAVVPVAMEDAPLLSTPKVSLCFCPSVQRPPPVMFLANRPGIVTRLLCLSSRWQAAVGRYQ